MPRSSTTSPSALGLMVVATCCAFLGLVLLGHSPIEESGDRRQQAVPTVRSAPSPSKADRSGPTPGAPSPSEVPRNRIGAAKGLPVPGDGPAGDRAVQRLLEQSSPSDLPREEEHRLVRLAEQVWMADVTGRGRDRWPSYFAADRSLGARSAYTQVRIQAGIARKSAGGRVQVRLVWAGADPSGAQRDGRLADIRLRLVPGHSNRWEPVR